MPWKFLPDCTDSVDNSVVYVHIHFILSPAMPLPLSIQSGRTGQRSRLFPGGNLPEEMLPGLWQGLLLCRIHRRYGLLRKTKSSEELWDEYKRDLNPQPYPVDLSQELWNHKMRLISQVRTTVSMKRLDDE